MIETKFEIEPRLTKTRVNGHSSLLHQFQREYCQYHCFISRSCWAFSPWTFCVQRPTVTFISCQMLRTFYLFIFIIVCIFRSQQMAKRPVSAMGNKRPISEYAKRAAALGGNPRYKVLPASYKTWGEAELLLLVHLEMYFNYGL